MVDANRTKKWWSINRLRFFALPPPFIRRQTMDAAREIFRPNPPEDERAEQIRFAHRIRSD